ncbi:N-acetylneuraminate synthase family protein [Pelagibacterales bacterium SAG-MED46]|nr:N-acetylneuraminate synthase family protein [Pelagibacterales bacterium SAG-MED46]
MKKVEKIKIIAEIGPNHNGDINLAKRILKKLSKIKIDYVKFQLGNPFNIYSNNAIFANYQKSKKFNNPIKMSLQNQLSQKSHRYLKKLSKELNLKYACTAFDLQSLIFLDKELKIPFFKIASGEIHSIDMLEYISRSNKPIILSTGMANFKDIEKSLKILTKFKKQNITLLHCVSSYPTDIKNMNLKRIDHLKKRFKLNVGLSDHSLSNIPAILSVAKNVKIIEKHVTLSRKLIGPDHKASLEIKEFEEFVKNIKDAEILHNTNFKKNTSDELNVKKVARKSIVSNNLIKKGTKITEKDIAFKRPGYGISPLDKKKVLGKKAVKNILPNTLIFQKDMY